MSDTPVLGDIRVSGVGTIPTGRYGKVSVSGSGTLIGDVECTELKVSGAADGDGTLNADAITVHGSLSYRGPADARTVKVTGSARFGALKAEEVNASGTLSASSVSSGTVKLQGYLSVTGDCEAERFVTQGAFTIDGLLNAGVVDVTLGDKCKAGEIGGETVVVRNYPMGGLKRFVTSLMPSIQLRLWADSIEGDDVRLENTTARAVRGTTVVIGPECTIDLVEYTQSYSAAPDAVVKEVRQVGAEAQGGDAGA